MHLVWCGQQVDDVFLPGCLKWRGGAVRVSSVCCRLCPCPSPRHPSPNSGSGPGHPERSPCPCGSLCADFLNQGFLWAPGCASGLGTPGSPSHRHSLPCIYCSKYKKDKMRPSEVQWWNEVNKVLIKLIKFCILPADFTHQLP